MCQIVRAYNAMLNILSTAFVSPLRAFNPLRRCDIVVGVHDFEHVQF